MTPRRDWQKFDDVMLRILMVFGVLLVLLCTAFAALAVVAISVGLVRFR